MAIKNNRVAVNDTGKGKAVNTRPVAKAVATGAASAGMYRRQGTQTPHMTRQSTPIVNSKISSGVQRAKENARPHVSMTATRMSMDHDPTGMQEAYRDYRAANTAQPKTRSVKKK